MSESRKLSLKEVALLVALGQDLGPSEVFSVLSWFFLCKSVASGCCLFVLGLSLSSLSSASLSTLFLSLSLVTSAHRVSG